MPLKPTKIICEKGRFPLLAVPLGIIKSSLWFQSHPPKHHHSYIASTQHMLMELTQNRTTDTNHREIEPCSGLEMQDSKLGRIRSVKG
jgi:hypothetical protein